MKTGLRHSGNVGPQSMFLLPRTSTSHSQSFSIPAIPSPLHPPALLSCAFHHGSSVFNGSKSCLILLLLAARGCCYLCPVSHHFTLFLFQHGRFPVAARIFSQHHHSSSQSPFFHRLSITRFFSFTGITYPISPIFPAPLPPPPAYIQTAVVLLETHRALSFSLPVPSQVPTRGD